MKHKKLILNSIVGFTIIIAFILLMTFYIIKPIQNKSNILTVYSDNEYYSETTYFKNENDFNNSINKFNQKQAVKASDSTTDKKFVAGIEKKVWVGETYDSNGSVTSSRLLKKNEIEKLNNMESQSDVNSENLVTSATHSLGLDETSFYALRIWMTADYYASLDYYSASAFSIWDREYYSNDKKEIPEMNYEDYAGYTWGGEGTLQAIDHRTVCQYYDSKSKQYSNLNASRTLTNSYAGVVWQFLEKTGTNNCLDYSSSYVNLQKVGSLQNKATSLRFTYIHTYDVVKGSVSITMNSNGTIAGGLTLSNTEKKWQVEIDLPGFEY